MRDVGMKFLQIIITKSYLGCLTIILGLALSTGCNNAPNINYYVQPRNSSLGAGTHSKQGCFIGELDGKVIRMRSHPDLTNLCVAQGRLIGWQMKGIRGRSLRG